jgi:hypothetical protein
MLGSWKPWYKLTGCPCRGRKLTTKRIQCCDFNPQCHRFINTLSKQTQSEDATLLHVYQSINHPRQTHPGDESTTIWRYQIDQILSDIWCCFSNSIHLKSRTISLVLFNAGRKSELVKYDFEGVRSGERSKDIWRYHFFCLYSVEAMRLGAIDAQWFQFQQELEAQDRGDSPTPLYSAWSQSTHHSAFDKPGLSSWKILFEGPGSKQDKTGPTDIQYYYWAKILI